MTVAVVLATVVRVARGTGPVRDTQERVVAGVSARRLMFEALVVAAAIGGALLLRDRGVAAVSEATDGSGVDPLIAAVPALVGVAAGILVVRLYPIPLAGVAWLAARGRGLVPMLAARRAREGGAASAVLLVLLATATVGAFAATALDHLDRGAEVAAWQEVGASWRIEQPNGALPIAMDPGALPEVEVASSVFQGLVPVDLSGPAVDRRHPGGREPRGGPRRERRSSRRSRPGSRRPPPGRSPRSCRAPSWTARAA